MTRHYITVGCRYLAKLTGYEPADPKLAALALKVNCEFYMNAYVVVTLFLVFVIYSIPILVFSIHFPILTMNAARFNLIATIVLAIFRATAAVR